MVPILLSSDPYTVVPSTLSLPIRLPISLSLIAIDISSRAIPLTNKVHQQSFHPNQSPAEALRYLRAPRWLKPFASVGIRADTFSGWAGSPLGARQPYP